MADTELNCGPGFTEPFAVFLDYYLKVSKII